MVRRTLNEMDRSPKICIFRLSQVIWAVFVFLLRKTGIIFFCTIISDYLMKLCKILGWKNTFELCFKNCNQISIRPTTGFIMWSHNQIFSQQDFFSNLSWQQTAENFKKCSLGKTFKAHITMWDIWLLKTSDNIWPASFLPALWYQGRPPAVTPAV